VITLNWFKKTQTNENETSEKQSTQNIETDQVDSENSQNEQNLSESEIKTQTQHIESISKKLVDVKKEYDTAIENLISIKKELIQKKKDMASLNTMSSISQISSGQLDGKIIESNKIKQEKDILENIQDKIKRGQKELEVAKKLIGCNKTKINRNMPKTKDIAIWLGILGCGIAFFFFYGIMADFMR